MSDEWQHDSGWDSQQTSEAIDQLQELMQECSLASNWIRTIEQDDALKWLYRMAEVMLQHIDDWNERTHVPNKLFAMEEPELVALFESIAEMKKEYAIILGRNTKRRGK